MVIGPAPKSGAADAADASRLAAHLSGIGAKTRGLPPVDMWDPPFCGDIDMRIAADGSWHYMGSPIGRAALVKLFSSVLRRDADGRTYLVTPVEKVGIRVDDAPFLAVEMTREGHGRSQVLAFRTLTDDWSVAGPENPLRFGIEAGTSGLKPYVHVRGGMDALLSRAITHDLVALAADGPGVDPDGGPANGPGIWSGGAFFAFGVAHDREDGEENEVGQ